MEKNYQKELTLKSNSVKRLFKECGMYEAEFQKLNSKNEEMKENGSDEYSMKKQKEYLEETLSVRNVTRSKLRSSTDVLTSLINEIDAEEIKNLDEYKNANEILESVKQFFEKIQD